MATFSVDFAGASANLTTVGWTKFNGGAGDTISRNGSGSAVSAGSRPLYHYGTDTDSNACAVQIDFNFAHSEQLLFVCSNGTFSFPWPNGYCLFINTASDVRLLRNGTQLGGLITMTVSGTRTIRIVHDGAGALEVFNNGVSVATRTDGTPLTAKKGGFGYGFPTQTALADNFLLEDLVTTHSGSASTSISWVGATTGIAVRRGAVTGSTAYGIAATGTSVHTGAATGSTTYGATATGVSVRRGAALAGITYSTSATGEAPVVDQQSGSAVLTNSWAVTATGARASVGVATGTVTFSAASTGATVRRGSATTTVTYSVTATSAAGAYTIFYGTIPVLAVYRGSTPVLDVVHG